MKSPIVDGWPTGELGDLVISAGQSSQLPCGVYDFNSVTIQAGASLEILPAVGWCVIGVKGALNLQGRIICRNFEGLVGTITQTAPDGKVLTATRTQASGGTGGSNTPNFPGAATPNGGNPSSNGNGGGGAAVGRNGGDATANQGGQGAVALSHFGGPSDYGIGGPGGSGPSANGQPGGAAGGAFPPDDIDHCGGGGGGGTHGRSGGLLYLCVGGDFEAVGGVIDISAETGGVGGAGGNAGNGSPGSGGGGGAGGNGGVLVVRFGGSFAPPSFVVLEGQGGAGGTGGKNLTFASEPPANPGGAGMGGVAGQLDLAHL